MNIPFLSSTAINRDHYHLVRSVEAANTAQHIDTILVHKVEYIRKRFANKGSLSLSECSYALIILLYCWLNTGTGDVKRELLEFALPKAVNLAESGSTIQQKRIGYTFCFSVMDKTHDLQLMLVNTLRKDIESLDIPRISLALDFLSMKCPVDVLPAIIPRLTDLLTHHSPLIKSKALIVVWNVARDDPHFWPTLSDQLSIRLNDPDKQVIVVTMRTMQDLLSVGTIKSTEAVELLLQRFPSVDAVIQNKVQSSFIRLLRCLIPRLLNDETDSVTKLLDIVFHIIDISSSQHAVLLECFRIFSQIPSSTLLPYFRSQKYHPFRSITGSIDDSEPNAIYFCLACLEHVDAIFWTGSTDEFPAIFNETQVDKIMSLLQCPDYSLRLKVLRTLKMVDKKILLEYLLQLISNLSLNYQPKLDVMALEVAGIYEEEGQNYAIRLKEICASLGKTNFKIFTEALETVLLHLRKASDRFRGHFVDEIIRTSPSHSGPTMALTIAATMYEYGHLSSISSTEQLEMLMDLLEAKPAMLQEPILLVMLRIAAFREAVPVHIIERVRELHPRSKPIMKKRCTQFLTFSNDLSHLRHILNTHKCDSLPEFLGTLDLIEKYGEITHISVPYRDRNQTITSTATKGELRYEAYEAPQAPLKQTRSRDLSQGPSFESSSKSSLNTPRTLTLSPGQLALAVYEMDLSKVEAQDTEQIQTEEKIGDDLITLDSDSPFLVDAVIPIEGASSHVDVKDFDHYWHSLRGCPSIRGWSERGKDQIVASFYIDFNNQYEVKDFLMNEDVGLVLLSLTPATSGILAAIRLHSGEEGTTLWQMRCPDINLRKKFKLQFV